MTALLKQVLISGLFLMLGFSVFSMAIINGDSTVLAIGALLTAGWGWSCLSAAKSLAKILKEIENSTNYDMEEETQE